MSAPAHTLEDALFEMGLEAMLASDFARGQQVFGHLRALGAAGPETLLALAVCADQNRDDGAAHSAMDELRERVLVGGEPLAAEVIETLAPWLPGGSRCRRSPDALAAAAGRMLPRLGH